MEQLCKAGYWINWVLNTYKYNTSKCTFTRTYAFYFLLGLINITFTILYFATWLGSSAPWYLQVELICWWHRSFVSFLTCRYIIPITTRTRRTRRKTRTRTTEEKKEEKRTRRRQEEQKQKQEQEQEQQQEQQQQNKQKQQPPTSPFILRCFGLLQ